MIVYMYILWCSNSVEAVNSSMMILHTSIWYNYTIIFSVYTMHMIYYMIWYKMYKNNMCGGWGFSSKKHNKFSLFSNRSEALVVGYPSVNSIKAVNTDVFYPSFTNLGSANGNPDEVKMVAGANMNFCSVDMSGLGHMWSFLQGCGFLKISLRFC